jgi:hypothetical protein
MKFPSRDISFLNFFPSQSVITKESKPLPPLDFSGYASKLKFTGSGVAKLEAAYKSTTIPQFTAEIPQMEKRQREELLSVISTATDAAQADLDSLYVQREEFENKVRVNMKTTMYDIRRRFPDVARSNEDEINQMLWFYNKAKTREARAHAIEDNELAHCQHDGSQYAGDYGYKLKTGCIPEIVGEDSYVAKDIKQYTGRVGPEAQ